MHPILACLTLLIAAVVSGPSHASSEATPSEAPVETAPEIQAVYVAAPPVIDGTLADECWKSAVRLEGFFPPDVVEPVPEETIGLICVDDAAIYVGFLCKDRTPQDIKAVETRRNGELWEEDFVEFNLDTWHQHQEGYSFRVSARGTQAEDIPGGSATKIEWRGDWQAAASRDGDGWQAEMAIPFSILRYPSGQSVFGFSIGRHFAAERIWVMHPIRGKAFNPALACNLVGLHPPAFSPRPILMPYVTLDLGESAEGRFGAGIDVQYRLLSGLTALATINPDFKQIEEVVEPIAFSYTERYLPDLRPFFVTGQGYLPDQREFYTRRVEDFDSGVKLFGSVGNESYGFLNAMTYGSENALAVRWRHQFTPEHDLTLWAVDHWQVEAPRNTVLDFGTGRTWRCPEGQDLLWATYRHSAAEGVESGAVHEIGGNHFRGEGRLEYDWGYRVANRGYRPSLGYFWDQDTRGGHFRLGKWHHYDEGAVEFHGWNIFAGHHPFIHAEGVQDSTIGPEYFLKLRRGYFLAGGFSLKREYNQDSSDAGLRLGWNDNDTYRRGGIFLLRGKRAGGDYSYVSLDQGFRPMQPLSVNLNLEYSRLAPPSPDASRGYQAVLTASYDLSEERSVSARLIARDAGVTAYAGYRQVVRRGTDIYVIVGDPDPARTGVAKRIAVKLIRVF